MKVHKTKKFLEIGLGKEPIIFEKKIKKIESNSQNTIGFIQSSEIGLLIALPITLGALFGWWLDDKFATKPRMMLSLLVFGVIIGFSNLFLVIKQYTKQDKK
jgi:F0F1-type ATP synthase assembly protein I